MENVFDITPFNYLFNKSTSIIDSNDILNNNISTFKKVLDSILAFDKSYLGQLNYIGFDETTQKRYSALHIALLHDATDNDVDLLLKYLCLTTLDVYNYREILPGLIKFQNFS